MRILPLTAALLAVSFLQPLAAEPLASGDHASTAIQTRCASAGDRTLRRRVVTAHFQMDRTGEADDLDGIGLKLPNALAERLNRAGRQLTVRDAGDVTVMPNPYLTDPMMGAEGVRALAQAQDAQLVIAGRVVSTAVTDRSVRPWFYHSPYSEQPAVYYNGPLSTVTGGALRYRASARQFELELWIYDGLTGALLAQPRLSAEARGDVIPDTRVPFASAAFWRTDYGKTVDSVLDRAVASVVDTIGCLPYSTRIVRVVGRQVYLDGGSMDGLQVGDRLVVYRPQLPESVRSLQGGQDLGVPESRIGEVTVVQVQPNLSVVTADGLSVAAGDLVRFLPPR